MRIENIAGRIVTAVQKQSGKAPIERLWGETTGSLSHRGNGRRAHVGQRLLRRRAGQLARALFLGLAIQGGGAGVTLAETAPRITVEGVGRIHAVPDIAVLQLGVVARAGSADEAMAIMARRMKAVIDALEKAGIASKEMATSRLALRPIEVAKPGQPPRIAGYEASEMLRVRSSEIEEVGLLIDAAMKAGANRVGGISFEISKAGELAEQARAAAVKDALERARNMAQAAGVSVGEVLSIEEVGQGGVPRPVMAMRAMDAAPPVLAGEGEISARVRMVLAISQR